MRSIVIILVSMGVAWWSGCRENEPVRAAASSVATTNSAGGNAPPLSERGRDSVAGASVPPLDENAVSPGSTRAVSDSESLSVVDSVQQQLLQQELDAYDVRIIKRDKCRVSPVDQRCVDALELASAQIQAVFDLQRNEELPAVKAKIQQRGTAIAKEVLALHGDPWCRVVADKRCNADSGQISPQHGSSLWPMGFTREQFDQLQSQINSLELMRPYELVRQSEGAKLISVSYGQSVEFGAEFSKLSSLLQNAAGVCKDKSINRYLNDVAGLLMAPNCNEFAGVKPSVTSGDGPDGDGAWLVSIGMFGDSLDAFKVKKSMIMRFGAVDPLFLKMGEQFAAAPLRGRIHALMGPYLKRAAYVKNGVTCMPVQLWLRAGDMIPAETSCALGISDIDDLRAPFEAAQQLIPALLPVQTFSFDHYKRLHFYRLYAERFLPSILSMIEDEVGKTRTVDGRHAGRYAALRIELYLLWQMFDDHAQGLIDQSMLASLHYAFWLTQLNAMADGVILAEQLVQIGRQSGLLRIETHPKKGTVVLLSRAAVQKKTVSLLLAGVSALWAGEKNSDHARVDETMAAISTVKTQKTGRQSPDSSQQTAQLLTRLGQLADSDTSGKRIVYQYEIIGEKCGVQ